jgi:hypothetical protein
MMRQASNACVCQHTFNDLWISKLSTDTNINDIITTAVTFKNTTNAQHVPHMDHNGAYFTVIIIISDPSA